MDSFPSSYPVIYSPGKIFFRCKTFWRLSFVLWLEPVISAVQDAFRKADAKTDEFKGERCRGSAPGQILSEEFFMRLDSYENLSLSPYSSDEYAQHPETIMKLEIISPDAQLTPLPHAE